MPRSIIPQTALFGHDQGNITIAAKYIKETAAAYYLDCEGDKVWVPKSKVTFNDNKLTLPDWLYKEKFPEG